MWVTSERGLVYRKCTALDLVTPNADFEIFSKARKGGIHLTWLFPFQELLLTTSISHVLGFPSFFLLWQRLP
jgi:hypothetical protein